MANDISGFGLIVNVQASQSFPVGFPITQFADDSDPFDFPSLQIADKAMGINGDLVTWKKANPIIVTLSVIPGSTDDIALSTLFELNRVGKGKRNVRDSITLTAIYPDGRVKVMTPGVITDGMPGNSVASAGRLKSKSFSFAFENMTGV